MAWSCPPDGELRYRVTLFLDVDPAARHLALISTESGERDSLSTTVCRRSRSLVPDRRCCKLSGGLSLPASSTSFSDMTTSRFSSPSSSGAKAVDADEVVVALTVAHSLTLTLAVLDVVRLPSSVVEPLIAATIVYVAAENFFVRDISKRWRATFLLGLVHGFGFAGALRESACLRRAAAGVGGIQYRRRIGQVAIVALIFPLLLSSDRLAARPERDGALRWCTPFPW